MRSEKNLILWLIGALVVVSFIFTVMLSDELKASDIIKIGLNYPETGPYAKQGLDQRRAADLAVEEINAAGGILGKKVQLVYRDTRCNPKLARENAIELYDKEGVQMIFGGSSSAVIVAVGKVAKEKKKLAFGTLTYATEVTGEEGHKFIFRECYDSYMAAKVLADYLKKNFGGKKYFYITSDYNWGWTTEDAFRKFTGTEDKDLHKGILTKLGTTDFKAPLSIAQEAKPDVLILVQFGRDMEIALKQAYEMGLKKTMQIVVPNINEDMAAGAGPEAMEGVLGTLPWSWKIPFEKGYQKGIDFVKKFESKYGRYPTTSGASAYTILHQYKEAVERAKSFDTMAVIKALEGHRYTMLKDEQYWRAFDHQSVQTVYAVRGKKADEVRKDKYQLDYFEVINEMKGDAAAISFEEWSAARLKVGLPTALD
ncbi:MAG: substrate-binding protein [Thermodesulfovibrionales bacterium]|nr:substrate-binding protein [Thermodesulfovibrionales bacterium]